MRERDDEEAAVPGALVAVELDAELVVAGDEDVVIAGDLALAPPLEFKRQRVAAGKRLDDLRA